jgi:hypothetical protein
MDHNLLQELTEDQRKEFDFYAAANFILVKRKFERYNRFTHQPFTEICFFAHHPNKGTFLITGDAPMEWINNAITDEFDIIDKKLEFNNQLSLF